MSDKSYTLRPALSFTGLSGEYTPMGKAVSAIWRSWIPRDRLLSARHALAKADTHFCSGWTQLFRGLLCTLDSTASTGRKSQNRILEC